MKKYYLRQGDQVKSMMVRDGASAPSPTISPDERGAT